LLDNYENSVRCWDSVGWEAVSPLHARSLIAWLTLFPLIHAPAWPADGAASLEKYTPAERRHWAFQPRKPALPPASPDPWARRPIDAFILEKLRAQGLKPAPAADRATLLRRVTFDLHGLPPTPREIRDFLNDRAPGAWERVVDRLLASPRYGEQWGRHWLDVVRFAESDGFEYDTHRHDAWRYRDYVIHAFNSDKPYHEFVREQIAGDELNARNETLRVAAGYNRLGPLRKNAGNQEVASSRNEVLTEMTNIVGASVLGVTLGCARCHDHKFDPIRHTDYYRMQGYFAQTHEQDVPLAAPEEQASWKTRAEPLQAKIKALQTEMSRAEESAKPALIKQIEDLSAQLPPPLPSLFSVQNDAARLTPIHVLNRGEYSQKLAPVGMRPLGVLLPEGAPELPLRTDAPRTRLADWITDPAHPLTARVIVNRIWLYHFGRGLVATPNDFGRMGARPSHPELLDWLANRFVEGGWTMKAMHREILLSNTYQQSGHNALGTLAREKDPANRFLWKFPRRRLEAEEIRDAQLAIAGSLNPKAGGPSVIVPVEPDLIQFLYKPEQWAVTRDPADHARRSVYLIQKRNFRLPMMEVFDAPDLQLSCARREQSTHAPQALELLNGEFANNMAQALAGRLLAEPGTPAQRIRSAYLRVTGRPPSPSELALATRFFSGRAQSPGAWKEFSLAMLNLNAFLYVN
jgi:hypothetical protein